MTISTDYPCFANNGFLIHMLVAMHKECWLCALDVLPKGIESDVDIIIFIMNLAWGVVRDEHIHSREM